LEELLLCGEAFSSYTGTMSWKDVM
jgi:hypothetical protein